MKSILEAIFGDVELAPERPLDVGLEGVHGTRHLDPILDSLLALGLAVDESGNDGWSLGDGATLLKPVIKAGAAFKHLIQAKEEVKDLTPYELELQMDRVQIALSGFDDRKAARVGACLANLAPGFLELIQAIQDLRDPNLVVKKAEIVPE